MTITRTMAVALGLLLGGCATLNESLQQVSAAIPVATQTPPGEAEIAAGLKEALAQGVTTAISSLGRTNGFWSNAAVRVPLPKNLAKAEGTLRKLGMGARVDEFQLALNRAAEQAVPQVANVFGDAVRQMSLADARAILQGEQDAATQYFRRTAGTALEAKVRPYVEATTQKVGVTQKYKSLMSDYGPLLERAGFTDTDLDGYVTGKAIDGLFFQIAAEEARIRRDPRARATELMRRVFGAG